MRDKSYRNPPRLPWGTMPLHFRGLRLVVPGGLSAFGPTQDPATFHREKEPFTAAKGWKYVKVTNKHQTSTNSSRKYQY